MRCVCLKGAGSGLLVCCLHKLYLDVVCAEGVEPVDLLSIGIIVCVQVHVRLEQIWRYILVGTCALATYIPL